MQDTKPIKILFAEDLPADAEMAIREIKKGGIEFTYKIVDTETEFRKELESFRPDIVVSDYLMPTFDGMAALKITQSFTENIPFIILTGSMNEETAVACMKAGANDYVIKEQIKRLPFSVLETIEKSNSRKEKIKILEKLRESESMYRSLIKNSNDAIYLIYDGKFEIINTEFERLFGYKLHELNQPGFGLYNLVSPESRLHIEGQHAKILNGKIENDRYEFKAITKKGQRKDLEASVSHIKFKDGMAIQGIIRDISEKKTMIEDLVAAKEKAEENSKLKTAFLQNISHEIRTPMNGILGFSELLKNPVLDSKSQAEYIDIILKSGERMLNIINNIVDISKIETGQIKIEKGRVNINQVINDIFLLHKPEGEKKGLKININIALPETKSIIFTDEIRLAQVFDNLVRNAIKFTSQGSVDIGYEVKNNYIEFYVHDTGKGIEPALSDNIFERFVQEDSKLNKSYEGAGLGLSISKELVTKLGGKIWFDSKPGNTTFYFTMPYDVVSNISQPTNISKPAINIALNNNHTLLIVEDDELSALYLEEILANENYRSITANNGNEAIQIIRENKNISAVLMDIKLPEMNGFDVTKEIKKLRPDMPIIAQTAYTQEEDVKRAIEAGCVDYITKPINKDHLFKIVKKYVSMAFCLFSLSHCWYY